MASHTDDNCFKRMVAYFWKEKEDPERYTDWDEERCKRLMPAFHTAWSQYKVYKKLANIAADNEGDVGDDY